MTPYIILLFNDISLIKVSFLSAYLFVVFETSADKSLPAISPPQDSLYCLTEITIPPIPGALSSSGRRDFKAVLEAFTETEVPMPGSGQWANAGMVRGRGVDLAWCVYDAQHFGTDRKSVV